MAKRFPTRRQFKEWLDGFCDGQIVGRRRESCDCPLARFLKSHGWVHPEVDEISVCDSGVEGPRFTKVPKWGATFIDRIDGGGAVVGVLIKARTARRILAEVPGG